jgi:hypothetical protein
MSHAKQLQSLQNTPEHHGKKATSPDYPLILGPYFLILMAL